MADSGQQQGPAGEEGAGGEQVSQEELRQRLEEQLKKVRVQDMLVESAASILNLTARRIAKEDERDLEQARLGIDAVRALVDMLEPEPRSQVQNALAELQMLYARESGGGTPGEAAPGGGERQGRAPGGEGGEGPGAPGGGRRESGLWTPPGSA
jgi:hypothetical protein